jgi:hypothetical protein
MYEGNNAINKAYFVSQNEDYLLLLLSEELKQPLIAINQLSEINRTDVVAQSIGVQSKRALRTIDNIMLCRRIHSGQIKLHFEPTHIGETARQVSITMNDMLTQQACSSRLILQNELGVMNADKRVVRAILESLWQGLALASSGKDQIICSASRTKGGIRVSLRLKNDNLTAVSMVLSDNSMQPVKGLAGPAADLIAAKELCRVAGLSLTKTSRSIGVTIPFSQQLQLL